MQDFDDEKKDKKVRFTDGNKFNSILDDHILAMKKGGALPIPKEELQSTQDDKRRKELQAIRSKDYLAYLKEKFPQTDPSEFYLPKDGAEVLSLE